MEKLKELNELKHTLIDAVKAELAGGIQNVNTEEMGEVVDMIKDLASAEKDCMEAAFYETTTEAMTEGEERMGYDRWRYSSGRFAPKGRGTYGYTPNKGTPVYSDTTNGRMGNTGNKATNGRMGRMGNTMIPMDMMNGGMRYGYDDPKDTMTEAMDSMREVWGEADHATKMKVRDFCEEIMRQMED